MFLLVGVDCMHEFDGQLAHSFFFEGGDLFGAHSWHELQPGREEAGEPSLRKRHRQALSCEFKHLRTGGVEREP